MYGTKWELDDYFADQMIDNPQLFETNVLERFPRATGYTAFTQENGKIVLMILQEGSYEDQFTN